MSVQNGLITLKTGIQRGFTILFPETDELSPVNFPEFLLFDTFLKIGYFTCIVPFRICKGLDGQYKVTTHVIQQVISTVLILCSTTYSLLSIRLLFQTELKRNPSEAFAVIYGMMKQSVIAVWAYTFWLCRDYFHKFVLVCQTKSSSASIHFVRAISTTIGLEETSCNARQNSVNWKVAVVARLVVVFLTIKLAVETFETINNWKELTQKKKDRWTEMNFLSYVLKSKEEAGQIIFWNGTNGNETLNNTSSLVSFDYNNWLGVVTASVLLLFGTIQDYVHNMTEAFCFLGAALIYSVCWRFTQDIPKMKSQDCQEDHDEKEHAKLLKVLERMSIEFTELTKVVEATNAIFGPLFLLYILGAFPSLGGFMLFKQKSSLTNMPMGTIAIATTVTMHVLVSMVASEGSSKMCDYKSWLFDASLLRKKSSAWSADSSSSHQAPISNAVLARLNHLHREVSSDEIGLKGCGFFTMTHQLIGTLLGVFVTFAIVILQFEMDTANK